MDRDEILKNFSSLEKKIEHHIQKEQGFSQAVSESIVELKIISKEKMNRIMSIEEKVDKQNGRVRKNEIKIAIAIGGLSVITAIVIPLLVYIYTFSV